MRAAPSLLVHQVKQEPENPASQQELENPASHNPADDIKELKSKPSKE